MESAVRTSGPATAPDQDPQERLLRERLAEIGVFAPDGVSLMSLGDDELVALALGRDLGPRVLDAKRLSALLPRVSGHAMPGTPPKKRPTS